MSNKRNDHPLTRATLNKLKTFFDIKQHYPSKSMWDALEDLALHLERMANGELQNGIFYLSSLDPGVGKTATLIQFTKELLNSAAHKDVTMLICMAKRDEIEAFINDAALDKNDFAILTSNHVLNLQGNSDSSSARILLTTQQMVDKRCRDKCLTETEEFQYQGKKRTMSVWDESLNIGIHVSIKSKELGELFIPAAKASKKLAEWLEHTHGLLMFKQHNDFIDIPDFDREFGVDLNKMLSVAKGKDERVKNTITTLWSLAGRSARVFKDGNSGNTVINYTETLPKDITPLLILDASGRIRGTYSLQEQCRNNLVRLKTAPKDYKNLTINVWNKRSGADASDKDISIIASAIAEEVNKKPNESWLIIHKKDIDYEKLVTPLLDDDAKDSEVHYLTWGKHTASNEYVDCENVFLTSVLYYSPSQYESLGHLWSDRSIAEQMPNDEMSLLRSGEHCHHILQSLCRSKVRKCEGDHCPKTTAYISTSRNTGVFNSLTDIFPKCTVNHWSPNRNRESKLTKKGEETIGYLKECLEDGRTSIPIKEVYKQIGMNHSNFKRCIRIHPAFINALDDLSLMEYGSGKLINEFRRKYDVYFSEKAA